MTTIRPMSGIPEEYVKENDDYRGSAPVAFVPFARDDAAMLIDSVRRAVGVVPARTALAAVRHLAMTRNGAADERARRAAMSRTGEAVAYGDSPVPDAWHGSRSHETTVKRSNSGRTVTTVVKSGTAHVQGSTALSPELCENPPTDGISVVHPGLLRRALDETRQTAVGRSGIDVARIADAAYGPLGLPAMLGWEGPGPSKVGNMPAEIVDPAPGTDVRACRVAFSRSQLSGVAHDATVDEIASHGDVYAAHTRHQYQRRTFPTRTRVASFKLRKSERAMIDPTNVTLHDGEPTDVPAWRDWTVTTLAAPCDDPDRMFIGHRNIARGETAPRKPRQIRKGRTIGDIAAPHSVAMWIALVESLNNGDRIVTTRDGKTVATVTRGKSGRYNATPVDGPPVKSARTSLSVARKLHAVIG